MISLTGNCLLVFSITTSILAIFTKRSIKAYHKVTGDEFECKTRTELWGHYLKKDKGLLAEFNKKNGTFLLE